MTSTVRTGVVWVGLFLCATSCRRESEPNDPKRGKSNAEPNITITLTGVVSDFCEGKKSDFCFVRGARGDSEFELFVAPGVLDPDGKTAKIGDAAMRNPLDWRTGLLIRGRELVFADGQMRIGARSYGKLEGDVTIEIMPKGVFVNGEFRGDLKSGSEAGG